ncbi:MAG: pyruvate kinase [Candidatus Marsarchaeota archaeon]|nr:pyruvate kinase [Candidatus Marsarchaeota archaeon]
MKVKIIATIGPSTSSQDSIKRLAQIGVEVFRVNFSHGGLEENIKKIKMVKKLGCLAMADLPGPKLRVEGFNRIINSGETISNSKFSLPSLKKGEKVFLSDGLIELEALSDEDLIVLKGGEVREGMGVNIPSIKNFQSPTPKDMEIIKKIKNLSDFIAISYAQSAESIKKARKNYNGNIIAKIETSRGVDNLDEIIKEADAVMVARGDLGVQLPFEQTPLIQKRIISACEESSKPVIVATQMLESMVTGSFPTRAEVTDVANAVLDGADALMLSEETAIGANPENAVKTMKKIILSTQSSVEERHFKTSTVSEAISESAKNISKTIKAKAILTKTRTGKTSLSISRFKSQIPIIALTTSEATFSKLKLAWNTISLKVKNSDEIPMHLFKKGDAVVLTYGGRFTTDSIKVVQI